MGMNRGKFIVFDGLDGSGKTTQAKRAAEYLFDRAKTNSVFLTREPYHSPYYQQIRDLLKSNTNPHDSAELFTELFVKDRAVHVADIELLLARGVHVVSDRYKYSTLGFQQAQGMELSALIKMHDGMLVPDLVVFIDLDVDRILERMTQDSRRDVKEVFEQKEMMGKLRERFLNLPRQLPGEPIYIVDGNRPADTVSAEIRTYIDKLFTS